MAFAKSYPVINVFPISIYDAGNELAHADCVPFFAPSPRSAADVQNAADLSKIQMWQPFVNDERGERIEAEGDLLADAVNFLEGLRE